MRSWFKVYLWVEIEHYSVRSTWHVYTARMSPVHNGSSVLQRFERGNVFAISNRIMFDFYLGLPHLWIMTTNLTATSYFFFPRACCYCPRKKMVRSYTGTSLQRNTPGVFTLEVFTVLWEVVWTLHFHLCCTVWTPRYCRVAWTVLVKVWRQEPFKYCVL